MKYGQTLKQRSVPQWAYQNVAYDSIKQLIKEHTTPGKGKAVTIPGKGETVDDNFEDQLFTVFAEQHDNVNLFVRSKSGEIDRRLDHLGRQLHNIQLASWPPSVIPSRIPPSRLAKYARLEEQALQAGEEIKLLSRFITVQKTAFVKLLKKYRKWTGRTWLDARWNTEVVASPDSFTNFDLDPFFEHWADRLQEIRFAMGSGSVRSGLTTASQSPAINAMAPKQSSVTVSRHLHEAMNTASDVDFDAVLATAPLGSEGTRAVYWVHPEQLVELQVLLLQYTRLAFPKPNPAGNSSAAGTPTITRRSSSSTPRRDSFSDRESCSGIIVFDDADEFALTQNSVPISATEASQARPPSDAAMTLRWTTQGDVSLNFRDLAKEGSAEVTPIPLKLKAKHFGTFLAQDKPFMSGCSEDSDNQKGLIEARTWLSDHSKVTPLVGVYSKRSRFVNLTGGDDCGQWGVLDMDIKMKKAKVDDFNGKEWATNIAHGATGFPFAILEIRQEGKTSTNLIKILDESHLTERVRGFSLFAHALWTCCRPRTMTPPFWLPVLSGDIRKLPSQAVRKPRNAAAKVPGSNSSVDREDIGSSSTAVSTGGESPFEAFVAPGVKGKSLKFASSVSKKHREPAQVNAPRYWNEYDDGEESSDENGYYIYINPDEEDGEETWLPFQSTFKALYSGFKKRFTRQKEEHVVDDSIHQPLLPPRVSKDRFFQSINQDYGSSTSSSETESDTDDDVLNRRIRYGTLPALQPSSTYGYHGDNDAIGLLLASIISLFFSATLAVVLLVLTAVGRKRARGEVDIVVLAGTMISLTFGIAGLWGMLRSGTGIMRWVIGISVFVGVLIIDVLQAGMLFKNVLAAIPDPS